MQRAAANESFVRAFQAAHGLTVDGWAGTRTFGALQMANDGEPPRAATRTSQRGIDLIHSFESLHRVMPDGRIAAYPDPGPTGLPWTIGWGSTGPDIGRDTIWTRAQADARFASDLARFERGVTEALDAAPTNQNQWDALVSFAYNVGVQALKGSTLLKKHRAGDYAGAQAEFGKWVNAKGKRLPGLVRRRAAEAALYGERP